MKALSNHIARRTIHWLKKPNVRLIMSISAAIGIGNGIVPVLTGNLGGVTGLLLGVAITAFLALGFSLIFAAIAQVDETSIRE